MGPTYSGCLPDDDALFNDDYGVTEAVRGALRDLLEVRRTSDVCSWPCMRSVRDFVAVVVCC